GEPGARARQDRDPSGPQRDHGQAEAGRAFGIRVVIRAEQKVVGAEGGGERRDRTEVERAVLGREVKARLEPGVDRHRVQLSVPRPSDAERGVRRTSNGDRRAHGRGIRVGRSAHGHAVARLAERPEAGPDLPTERPRGREHEQHRPHHGARANPDGRGGVHGTARFASRRPPPGCRYVTVTVSPGRICTIPSPGTATPVSTGTGRRRRDLVSDRHCRAMPGHAEDLSSTSRTPGHDAARRALRTRSSGSKTATTPPTPLGNTIVNRPPMAATWLARYATCTSACTATA